MFTSQRQGRQPRNMTEAETFDYQIDYFAVNSPLPLHYIIFVYIISFSTQEEKF
jgi:hypothetical protein